MMRWTDYCRMKEQVKIVQESINRLRQMLKHGTKDAVEREDICLKFNIEILKEFQKSLTAIEINTSRLEADANRLLKESDSYIGKKVHGGAYEWQNQ